MSKKATVNGFTGGLSMDLNPLTNTKEVLSDAINATLVTGNGDEMILLNDMGNIPLGSLPEGYVPVGCKEYGGIAYMALYNPKTKKCLLGTYPSPVDYNENGKYTGIFGYTANGDVIRKDLDDINLSISAVNYLTYNSDIEVTFDKEFENSVNSSSTDLKMWDISWSIKQSDKTDIPVQMIKKDNKYTLIYRNGNLGHLYLHLKRRKITHIYNTVNFIRYKDKGKLKGLDSEELKVINNIPKDGGVFIFTTRYLWNCPDGIGNNCGTPNNVINGIHYLIHLGNATTNLYYDHTSEKTRNNLKDGYERTVTTYLYITSYKDNEQFDITIYPTTYNKDLDELKYSVSINADDCDTPDIYLNTWNYQIPSIYDNTVNLTWGFYDVSLYKLGISNLQMNFFDLKTNNTINYTIPDKNSYNGTFNETLTVLNTNTIYFVKITFQILGKTYNEYRWMNTSGMYNNVPLQDFGSPDIIKYNNIIYNLDISKSQKIYQSRIENTSGVLVSTESRDKFNTVINTKHNFYFNLKSLVDSSENTLFDVDFYLKDLDVTYSDIKSSLTSFTPKIVGDLDDTFVRKNQTLFNSDTFKASIVDYTTDEKLKGLSDKDLYIRFTVDYAQALEGKSKHINLPVVFKEYFRPFVIDPTKVSRNLCKKLKSNYYSFGYELTSDFLPQIYFETLSGCTAVKHEELNENEYNRAYIINRSNTLTGCKFEKENNAIIQYDLNGKNMDDAAYSDDYVEYDDSPASYTDKGLTYQRILPEDLNNYYAQELISNSSIVSTYSNALSTSLLKDLFGDFSNSYVDIIHAKPNAWLNIFIVGWFSSAANRVLMNITVPRNKDNTIGYKTTNDKGESVLKIDEFSALLCIMADKITSNKFIPTFSFWGSAYLTDYLLENSISENYEFYTNNDDTQNNGIYENTDDLSRINYNSGIGIKSTVPQSGNNYCTAFKSLIPLWLDSQIIYSSINIAYSAQMPYSKNNPTPQSLRALDASHIIKGIINTFNNYYLYTKDSITIDNANIYLLDTNNVCYSNAINNILNIEDLSLDLRANKIYLGNTLYSDIVTKTLNKKLTDSTIFSDKSTNSKLTALQKTSVYLVKAVLSKVNLQYSSNTISDELLGVNDVNNISYPVMLIPNQSDTTDTNINGNTKKEETEPGAFIYKANDVKIISEYNNNRLNNDRYYTIDANKNISAELKFDLDSKLLPITVPVGGNDSIKFTTLIVNNGNSKDLNYWVVPNYIDGGTKGDLNNLPVVRGLSLLSNYSDAKTCAPMQSSCKHNHSRSDYAVSTYCNLPINISLQDGYWDYPLFADVKSNSNSTTKISTLNKT